MTEGVERLRDQHRIWEDWAQSDPLWAILSDPARKGGRWDLDTFFATGRGDIEQLFEQLGELGLSVRRSRCLDFGCGVGRLTQALAPRFELAEGVDIAETMIENARRYNTFGERCRYHVNVANDLQLFESGSFDLVYSVIVLQHIPPDDAEGYIREFVRVLAPGGLAVFDMSAAPLDLSLPEGAHRGELRLEGAAAAPLLPGSTAAVALEVTNTSGIDWRAGTPVRIGNHWRNPDGTLLSLDDGRVAVGYQGLAAGASRKTELVITAPDRPGPYLLDFDLVEEGVTWFADRGSEGMTVPVEVVDVPVPASSVGGPGGKITAAPATASGSNSSAQLESPAAAAEPPPFTMNGLPRDRVEAAVIGAGGRVAAVAPTSSPGPDWEAYRYFVTR